MATVPVMAYEDWLLLDVPPDESRAEWVYVVGGSGRSDFMTYVRKNAQGDNEWHVNADEVQVSVDPFRAHVDVGAGGLFSAIVPAVDLSAFSEVRFGMRVLVAGNTSHVRLHFTDDNTTWTQLTANYAETGTTGDKATDYEAIPSGARKPVRLSGYIDNGDGTEDPTTFALVAHLRR